MVDLLDLIKGRRSVREFLDREVSDNHINKIIEAGRWAPSGLNNQPWRFFVVKDNDMKERLAEQTHYGNIILGAPVNVVVFLDTSSSYDRTKDLQAVGTCIQNMLLMANSLGLGACWLGEILNKKEKVAGILQVPEEFELMAVISLGYGTPKERNSERKPLKELVYGSH